MQSCNIYINDIEAVFQLYRQYSQAFNHIAGSQFTSEKPQLADREMKVAILAAEGLSNLEIGKRLFISQNTVKTQLKSVFKKLGIHSRALLKYNTGIN